MALFTCLFFLSKRPLTNSDKIIAIFMLFLAIPMMEKLVLMKVIDIPYLRFGIFIGSALTFGPFLYLYARSEIHPDSPIAIKSIVHFIPFVASICLLIFLGLNAPQLIFPTEGSTVKSYFGRHAIERMMPPDHLPEDITGRPLPHDRDRINPPPPDDARKNGQIPRHPERKIRSILNACIVISLIVYTVLIFILLRSHRRNISDYFSYDSIAINLKWLNWITVCFFIAYGFVFFSAQFFPEFIRIPLSDPHVAPDVGTTFFIFAFSFCALKQPVIFKESPGHPTVPDTRDSEDSKEIKYKKSGLKESDAQNFLAVLEEYMRTEKPYLDPDLTIVDVASTLNIPKHYITQIINEKLNKNFFLYTNEYRVNEVKQKFADEKFNGHSILRIAYDSGFNSKSSFNDIFKKLTNVTPSEYKKVVQT